MANPFVNFLSGVFDGSGDMRDYQHASRLYVNNFYELAPKAGWIYYVVMVVNPKIRGAITDTVRLGEFDTWYNRYKGTVGLLAKSVDMPKFNIETEVMNQYNKKTVIQKRINYSPVSITFHDDMANVTTNLWKQYFQYYFADSITEEKSCRLSPSILPKYTDTKYNDYNPSSDYHYGLNNKQSIPFFIAVDIYQLYKRRFTSFKLVNPLIKEWGHDALDQSVGNKMLSSKMTIEYETVIYNTDPLNKITQDNPGFAKDHYDNSPSPLSIGGVGTNSIFGPGGIVAGASEVFGDLANIGTASPLDILNTAIKGANLVKNVKKVSSTGVKEEGYSILTGVLGNISSTPASVTNPDGTVSKVPAGTRTSQGFNQSIAGIRQVITPVGINLFTGNNSSVNGQSQATQKKIGPQ